MSAENRHRLTRHDHRARDALARAGTLGDIRRRDVLLAFFVVAVAKLLADGTGIWGIDRPVEWGFAIANYVWWIGMGMAGTFISAALLVVASGVARHRSIASPRR